MEPEKESASPPRISLWPLALLGTALALLSLRRSPAQSGENAPQSVHPKQTPTEECNQVNSSVVADMPPSPPQNHAPYRGQDHTPRWKKWLEIAGFFVILAYTTFAAFQWCAMLDSNKINREALESVQRAFVSAHRGDSKRFQAYPGTSHYWAMKEMFENSGTTVAKSATQYFEVQTLPSEPTEEQFKGNVSKFQFTSISPKETTFGDVKNVPEQQIFGIDLGDPVVTETTQKTHLNRQLFAWGWVIYRDVFPKTKPHVTEFCSHLSNADLVPNPDPKLATLTIAFSQCYAHNCVDEECEDYKSIVTLPRK